MKNKTALISLLLIGACSAGPDVVAPPASIEPVAFVQLFEWRWPEVALECERVLGPAGFTAVQISPPNEHIQGPAWWTRYQPVSFKIESRGGTRDEFADMVARCKAAGIDVYADAVINHMAGIPEGTGVAGSEFSEYNYPVPYEYNDFHHCGRNDDDRIVNYQDLWEIQNCQLGTLDDLDTGKPSVQRKIAAYLNDLLSLGVAGFRLDAVKHVDHDELHEILQRVDGEPFIYQEVIDRGGEPISAMNYVRDGRVTEFKYPNVIVEAFEYGNLDVLINFWKGVGWLPGEHAIVFVDNHDIQRGHAASGDIVNYKDGAAYDLAVAFMLAHPYGYPLVMSSYAFEGDGQGPPEVSPLGGRGCGDLWICEHRREATVGMLRFRAETAGTELVHWNIVHDAVVSFSRGRKGHVLINTVEHAVNVTVDTALPPGDYTSLFQARPVSVDDNGSISIMLEPQSVIAVLAGE